MGGTVSIIGSNKENGDRSFKECNYLEAIYWYSQALADSSLQTDRTSRGVLYSNRAACYIAINRPDKALDDAICCIGLRPTWFKGYYRAALSAKNCNLIDLSIDYIDKAIALSPTADDSLLSFKRSCAGSATESRSESLFSWNEDRYNPIVCIHLRYILLLL